MSTVDGSFIESSHYPPVASVQQPVSTTTQSPTTQSPLVPNLPSWALRITNALETLQETLSKETQPYAIRSSSTDNDDDDQIFQFILIIASLFVLACFIILIVLVVQQRANTQMQHTMWTVMMQQHPNTMYYNKGHHL